MINVLVPLFMYAQQPSSLPIPPLRLKANKNLYLVGTTAFSEDSFIPSAGIQAAKLLEVTYHDKNVVNFNIDFAGIQVRKQYHSGNIRTGGYLSGSFVKNIFLIDGYAFAAANRTIFDYGKNQFTSDAYMEDNAMHLEISNLTGISVQKVLFKKQKTKMMLFSGLNVSNKEQARIGYIVTILKYVSNNFFVLAKADNTTTFGHKFTLGVMYRL